MRMTPTTDQNTTSAKDESVSWARLLAYEKEVLTGNFVPHAQDPVAPDVDSCHGHDGGSEYTICLGLSNLVGIKRGNDCCGRDELCCEASSNQKEYEGGTLGLQTTNLQRKPGQ